SGSFDGNRFGILRKGIHIFSNHGIADLRNAIPNSAGDRAGQSPQSYIATSDGGVDRTCSCAGGDGSSEVPDGSADSAEQSADRTARNTHQDVSSRECCHRSSEYCSNDDADNYSSQPSDMPGWVHILERIIAAVGISVERL